MSKFSADHVFDVCFGAHFSHQWAECHVRYVPTTQVGSARCEAARRGRAATLAGAKAKMSRPRITCDLLRKMFRVFADAVQKRGLEFVEPRQARESTPRALL
jgi:hypothetical protein